MNQYSVNELRKMFLDFFESKNHIKLKSFSLVPHNDKSLLLINSGMAPLKPYFTGQEIPPGKRVTTCQKCIRTGDIENVGKTARHGTFFEMLGNFSFGDYFKRDAIRWSWEFLTEVVGLDADRLYPSIYLEDEEAFEIWNREIGIVPERIFRFGKEDNFWEHGAGPCGPCSEIYYDRGEKYGCGRPGCTVGCDCDRYMEVWNNVFTQFESDGNGNYTELAQKNIDTGMGLERLAVVVQDVDSIFDIDTMQALRDKICELADIIYGADNKKDISIRLITDHIRSVTFMISDGIMPSNEGRGYVLRRLLRRAARHARLLGIKGKVLSDLCGSVIEGAKAGYPELEEKSEFIYKVLTEEEDKFNKTIDQGLTILSELENTLSQRNEKILSGAEAFKLYDTYGFPLDLTKEILDEKGISIDEKGFTDAMEAQREKARSARKTTNYMGADATVYDDIDPEITSTFVGYDSLQNESHISVLTSEDEIVQALSDGEKGTVITEETVFYATMGGQEGDTGVITSQDGSFAVSETVKLKGGKVGHVGRVTSGMIKTGDKVTLTVYDSKRADICKNHSATHLLQKALRNILGTHVEQAGSFVGPDRLRFDFTHFQSLTAEEIQKAEDFVNYSIAMSIPVITEVMDLEDAKKAGAMALFGEKYADKVRVVKMGDASTELCGGTHVSNTVSILLFKIISESGIAAGVRRIEALTGNGVLNYYKAVENDLQNAAKAAKTEPSQLVRKIRTMTEEIKQLSGENEKLKNKLAKDALGDVLDTVKEIKGIKFLAAKVTDADMNGLRNLGDQLKDKIGSGVILLVASQGPDKVNMIAMATEDVIKKGAHAGNLIKEVSAYVGGGGGGRPNMAQAGGKNPNGIDTLLLKSYEVLEAQL